MRRTVTTLAASVLALLLVGLLVFGVLQTGDDSSIDQAVARGERPPAYDAALPLLAGGGSRRLADYRADGYVVVNFFASWCAPCKAEGSAFAAAAQAYKGRVQFVGVAIDDSRSGALSYTRRYGWHWPIVFDPHDHLVEPFGLLGKPTTFVLDSSGRVAWKLQRELSRDELTTALDDVLGQ